MAVELEIPDGTPWWLSTDVWTVPGSNPEGAPGVPVTGQPCYLWARVTNHGETQVDSATIRYYWANPAVGFDRTSANLVGTAYVDLGPGDTREVLCLTPWVPEYVNDGHECILAEAFHTSLDPLPGTPAFNVPTDRHVAQRNLSVVFAMGGRFKAAFEVHNPARKGCAFRITARQAKVAELEPLRQVVGHGLKLPIEDGKLRTAGFVRVPCPTPEQMKDCEPKIEGLEVGPGNRVGLTVVGERVGAAALVHIEQWNGDRQVGGASVLVIKEEGAAGAPRQKGGRKS